LKKPITKKRAGRVAQLSSSSSIIKTNKQTNKQTKNWCERKTVLYSNLTRILASSNLNGKQSGSAKIVSGLQPPADDI
jgi:hypothetical protein